MATEKGGDLYKRRQCMVEPVFAQIKSNRRMERFNDEAWRRFGRNGAS